MMSKGFSVDCNDTLENAKNYITQLESQRDTARRELAVEREARQKAEAKTAEYDRWLTGGIYFTNSEYVKHCEEINALKQRAESAEQRNREAMEQEPCSWEVYSEQGVVYSASYKEACHEHINDAINDFQLVEASRWRVRPVYAAPIPPADVAELQQQIELYAAEMSEAKKAGFYSAQDLYGAYLTLERKLAEQQALFHVNMLRAWPEKSHDEIAAAIKSKGGAEELTKLLEEARKQEREECTEIARVKAINSSYVVAAIRAKGN